MKNTIWNEEIWKERSNKKKYREMKWFLHSQKLQEWRMINFTYLFGVISYISDYWLLVKVRGKSDRKRLGRGFQLTEDNEHIQLWLQCRGSPQCMATIGMETLVISQGSSKVSHHMTRPILQSFSPWLWRESVQLLSKSSFHPGKKDIIVAKKRFQITIMWPQNAATGHKCEPVAKRLN